MLGECGALPSRAALLAPTCGTCALTGGDAGGGAQIRGGGRARLFLPSEELAERRQGEGEFRAYWDPTLKEPPQEYSDFVKDLVARDMVVFHLNAVEQAGVFCVWKNQEISD